MAKRRTLPAWLKSHCSVLTSLINRNLQRICTWYTFCGTSRLHVHYGGGSPSFRASSHALLFRWKLPSLPWTNPRNVHLFFCGSSGSSFHGSFRGSFRGSKFASPAAFTEPFVAVIFFHQTVRKSFHGSKFTCVKASMKAFVNASLIPRKLLLSRKLPWKKTHYRESFDVGNLF